MMAIMRRRQSGFTMVEAIAVIVITGIVGAFITVFIQIPIRTYLTTVSRAEATDLADNSMRRLTRDLRLALPNSVRVGGASNNYIEYLDTKVGLRYLAEDDVDSVGGGTYLSWNNPAATTFSVVGGVPGGRHAPVVGDSVVVYNLGPGQEPGNAYDCSSPGFNCNRAAITALTASTITMSGNPFYYQAEAGTPLMSPGKRFHVISGPVSYGCDSATRRLMRYWGYPIAAAQSAPPFPLNAPPVGARSAILADNVESCSFSYTSLANQRSGLIGITLRFLPQDGSTTPTTLVHQIHVNSTP
jgi:MSHA biogenesis protein MshO